MPAADVETDWNPAALTVRVHREIGANERVRVRPHEGDVQFGRIVEVIDDAPAAGAPRSLPSSTPAWAFTWPTSRRSGQGPAVRSDGNAAIRGSRPARTRSATAGWCQEGGSG